MSLVWSSVPKDVSYDEPMSLQRRNLLLLCHYSVPQVSKHERLLHTEHLGALMYLASIYERLGERGAHGTVLLVIERGRLNWGDSMRHLENRNLAGSHKKAKQQKRPARHSSHAVLFCREYQKGFALTLKITIYGRIIFTRVPKMPLISPGLIQLRKGFWVGL